MQLGQDIVKLNLNTGKVIYQKKAYRKHVNANLFF